MMRSFGGIPGMHLGLAIRQYYLSGGGRVKYTARYLGAFFFFMQNSLLVFRKSRNNTYSIFQLNCNNNSQFLCFGGTLVYSSFDEWNKCRTFEPIYSSNDEYNGSKVQLLPHASYTKTEHLLFEATNCKRLTFYIWWHNPRLE